MPSLCLIASVNGLGHVKRLVRIAACLRRLRPDVETLLVCAPWHAEALADWPLFRGMCAQALSCPLVWSADPARYGGGWLADWHQSLSVLALDRYDLVVSDNMVEPLAHGQRVVLSGSFLWHDVLAAAYPTSVPLADYALWCRDLLERRRPEMLANDLLAMPEVRQQTRMIGIGFVPLVDGAHVSTPGRLLVAVGSSPAAAASLDCALPALSRFGQAGWHFLAPRWAEPILAQAGLNTRVHDFEQAGLGGAALVAARAGMGTVADAVACGVPLLTIADDNPEIAFNADRLRRLGVARPLDASWPDEVWMAAATARMAEFPTDGAEQAAAFLSRRL